MCTVTLRVQKLKLQPYMLQPVDQKENKYEITMQKGFLSVSTSLWMVVKT